MAVPLPIEIVAHALPLGFKGNLQQTLSAFAEALSANVEATFLTGQVGGSAPAHDIGPWANGNEWWFWDPGTGQYQPSDQGSPVGTIGIWGGNGIAGQWPVPNNWLVCDGSAISRFQYSRLFEAIGTTWGVGDGQGTFNLPPKSVFFYSADNANPVNTRGGGATSQILASNLPALQSQRYGITQQISQAAPSNVGINFGLHTAERVDTAAIIDSKGVVLGTNTPLPIMPPFLAVLYIIKFL
jgi:microcystin-dependent protein